MMFYLKLLAHELVEALVVLAQWLAVLATVAVVLVFLGPAVALLLLIAYLIYVMVTR